MKKLTLLLLIACLIAGTQARAQTITYKKKNASLKNLINTIVKQTGYDVIFKGEPLERIKRVDITVTNASIKDVLDLFFKDQSLVYTITDNLITISPKIPLSTEVMTLTGRIMNDRNEFVPGVTITIKGSTRVVTSNDDGEFLIPEISKTATILLTSVAYEPFEMNLQGRAALMITLKSKVKELGEVSVVASGYQNIPKERSTGSYSKVNNELLNRRVSTNVLDRIDDVVSGMILNKNIAPFTNQSSRTIRGRSTIFSNAEPLIVVDNFPYPGNPDNINPNDIESITILKDANAASIWGAFAGNGVIVITTKKGKYSQAPKLTLNNNITVVEKFDAWYPPSMEPADYISLEEDLFARGYFTAMANDPGLQALSPVVELLIKESQGLIPTDYKNKQLDKLRGQDTRREIEKHFFRKGINQQYSINTSGGGANNHYYLSAGFDRNEHNLVGNKSQRVTLTANNSYSWFKNRLELNTGFSFAETRSTLNNDNIFPVVYPYLQFVDEVNDTLPIPYLIRQNYIDTLSEKRLLDWNYNPVKEVRESDNSGKLADYRINLGLKYKIGRGFTANLLYQFNKGQLDQENYRSTATYFTRNLINRFSHFDGGEIVRPVPNEGIAERFEERYKAQNVRGQLNYTHSWIDKYKKTHGFTALGGIEVRDVTVENRFNRLYGNKKGDPMGAMDIDYSTYFTLFHTPFLAEQIPKFDISKKTVDRYVSFYMTAAYTLQERYIFSISARKDESNLFGVETNKKGVPLFSLGAAWNISREKFYDWNWLPYLKFRATHGYNGNVNKNVSAYTTVSMLYPNTYGEIMGAILNPPNPRLRWEKVQITNLGVDFATTKATIEGSIDYYIKRGTDLIGNSPVDPSTGVSQFTTNSAKMRGTGIDMMVSVNSINRGVKWNTVLIFNHAVDKITSYDFQQTTIAAYYNSTLINPLESRPLYSIYSLKWRGLDPLTGDPLGELNDTISKNYSALRSSTNFKDLIYNGPANPTFFGAIRNTISWKQFSLSFNITWKAGHYFRRSSVAYYDLLPGNSPGHPDYNKRWQKPGDERITYVPSINYSNDPHRDGFYRFSEVLVEKGDLIRFQDLRFSYDLSRKQVKKLPMQLLSFYIYANNLGLLWKATEYDVDPDYVVGYPNPRTWSLGIKVDF